MQSQWIIEISMVIYMQEFTNGGMLMLLTHEKHGTPFTDQKTQIYPKNHSDTPRLLVVSAINTRFHLLGKSNNVCQIPLISW